MSEPSITSATTSDAPAALSWSMCVSSSVRTTTARSRTHACTCSSTRSAACESWNVITSARARMMPAAISTSRRAASP